MAVPDPVRARLEDLTGPLGIACSGGGDSLALLRIALTVRPDLHVVTVDHGLRPAAADEARAVAMLCEDLGLPHETLTLDLSPGPALMARARAARYDVMASWAIAEGIATVCLGHTANDVAETLLMRLSDGAGLDGLARMADRFERCSVTFVRPLLDRQRSELRRLVEDAGWTAADDPTNDDDRFERTRIRKALAMLEFDPNALARSAAALQEVQVALRWQVERVAGEIAHDDQGDWVIQRDALQDLPTDLIRRLLLAGLRWIGGASHPPRYGEQRNLLARIGDGTAATLQGVQVRPEGDHIRLSREPAAAARSPDVPVGSAWDGRWTVDGPSGTVRALGHGIAQLEWRETGLPRSSLMAAPAVWDGDTLLGTPFLKGSPWTATCRDPFAHTDGSR